MDEKGQIYTVLAGIGILVAVVCFWLISRKAPKGTLVVLGIVLWAVGRSVAAGAVRELMVIGGATQLCGTIAIVMGVIDAFRQRRPVDRNKDDYSID